MPYLLVFGILLACGLGLPIPEDITLFVAGMLAYYGIVNVWGMIIVCMAGVLIGDSTIFWLGAKYGKEITKKPLFSRLLSVERLAAVQEKLHQHGNKVIFVSRFMPLLRAPTFFSAGTLHLPFKVFFFYDGLAALISVPSIVWLVYHFGNIADRLLKTVRHVEYGILLAVVAVVCVMLAKWYFKHHKQQQ
ncbi:MAG: DedA family protein [Methylovulum sp.]|nr:DedA family protein [Methylovulum sp.]